MGYGFQRPQGAQGFDSAAEISKIQDTENQHISLGFLVALKPCATLERSGQLNIETWLGEWGDEGGAKKEIREVFPLPMSEWGVRLPAHLEKEREKEINNYKAIEAEW